MGIKSQYLFVVSGTVTDHVALQKCEQAKNRTHELRSSERVKGSLGVASYRDWNVTPHAGVTLIKRHKAAVLLTSPGRETLA